VGLATIWNLKERVDLVVVDYEIEKLRDSMGTGSNSQSSPNSNHPVALGHYEVYITSQVKIQT
jgi:hypothetical protein